MLFLQNLIYLLRFLLIRISSFVKIYRKNKIKKILKK